jgi:hypothetical protein
MGRLLRRLGKAGLVPGLACATLAASAASAPAATETFGFTGAEQTFTVPAGVGSLHVVAIGARGGKGSDESAKKLGGPGGIGASVEADLTVAAGQVLFIEVGGTGADGAKGGAGGFNGGGSSNPGGFELPGGGGGGATDIRSCSRLAASCSGSPDTLSSRLLVAAGGGGGGSDGRQEQTSGGEGGDAGKDGKAAAELGCSTGSTPGGGGQAGTQTAGGVGGAAGSNGAPSGNPGAFGQGGPAGDNTLNSEPGGGGGGGYFGGGAGGGGNGCGGGGGGGGSSVSAGANTTIAVVASGVPSLTISYTPKTTTTGGGGTTTTPAPPSSPPPPSLATLSSLAETNSIFAVATPLSGQAAIKRHPKGTTFSFRLDQQATVKLAIQAAVRGRRVGRSCKRESRKLRKRPRCTRVLTVATLTRSGHTGLNKVAFSGRVGGKALKPGHYRARFTAVNVAGASPIRTLTFTIVNR